MHVNIVALERNFVAREYGVDRMHDSMWYVI